MKFKLKISTDIVILTQVKGEMDPDPTRAYFWPAVNKRLTQLWPRYFPTRPKAIFFDPKGKKLKNSMFLGEIFEIQTQTINGWPNPTWPEPQKLTWPGKIFDPDPSLGEGIFRNQPREILYPGWKSSKALKFCWQSGVKVHRWLCVPRLKGCCKVTHKLSAMVKRMN